MIPLQRDPGLTIHLLLQRRELNDRKHERNKGCEEGCLKEEKREINGSLEHGL
jgi:hypothetical protein